MRVAEGRRLGDPETIHYGLVPRSNRGIIAINELPDLAERIQVSMLNVMEERDIQIRGYVLRLPLDVLVVASANPEDYTNRGRIITPLKDRFGAEIRTHYPIELDDEVAVIRQEGQLVADVPPVILEILARYTRALRQSPAINQTSGVSARFAIAGAETVAAAALRRASVRGEGEAVARIVDLGTAVDVLTGKIEFESGEEGREQAVLDHLLRTATAEAVRAHYHGIDLGPLVAALDGHRTVTTGDHVTAEEFLGTCPPSTGPGFTTRSAGAWARRTRGSVPPPSNLRWKACTSPAGSPRSPTTRKPSTASRRAGSSYSQEQAAGTGGVMASHNHSARYGRYTGGPDPLAPPVDLAEALDAVAEDVMAGYSPRHALQEFLRRGGRDREGLDDLARRVQQRRSELLGRHRLDGTLNEVQKLLETAVLEERKQLARDARMDNNDRAFRRCSCRTCRSPQRLRSTNWPPMTGSRAPPGRPTSGSRTCSAAKSWTSGSPA
jgi:hypothetical protein